MSGVRVRGEEIRRFILDKVQDNPNSISKLVVEHFKITRQAVNGHLRRLIDEGALAKKGQTRSRVYTLAPLVQWRHTYSISGNNNHDEDSVWRADIEAVLGKLRENVRDIWAYGFTEMFNNAISHSGGTEISVQITKTAPTTEMRISDDGIGIFRKIQKARGLPDERQAILELSKGKLTTDPNHHTGQGIFFTSKIFDGFDILSGGVFFSHAVGHEHNWLLERTNPKDGTTVFLKLGNHTARTTKKIFDQFTGDDPDDFSFNKTIVPVQLAQYGNDKLISRSQAKRVMARVEQFRHVLLDFNNVPTIGQAFADEIFRVFPLSHPQVQLKPIHANSEVKRMIARALRDAPSPVPSPSPEPAKEEVS